MNKLMLIACGALLILSSCSNNKNPNLDDIAQSDSLNSVLTKKDVEINDMLGTLNAIEDGFRQIDQAQGRINLIKTGEGANRSQQLKENVQFIAARMKQNKELIAKLEGQLKHSSIKSKELKKTITTLVNELKEKDVQMGRLYEELNGKNVLIAELDQTINDLNTNVNSLSSSNNQKTRMLKAQERQLNTAWYAFKTKRELKDLNILQHGKVLQSTVNSSNFVKIDIRRKKQFDLNSKYAKLLTSHPSGSYQLDKNDDGKYILIVTNPQIFWSTSKYLVVQVK